MSEVPGIDRANQRVDTANGAIDALRDLRSHLRMDATCGPITLEDVHRHIDRLENRYTRRWDDAIIDRQHLRRAHNDQQKQAR
jgi:hypothetical protein